MRKCIKCEHEYADEFAFCPHCGEEYSVVVEANKSAQIEKQELATVLSKTKTGQKLVLNETKNHYIKNSILLLFSLILFVCSFFTGVIYQFDNRLVINRDEPTFSVPVYLNTVDHMVGTFSIIESNEKIMDCYFTSGLSEVYYKAIQASIMSRLDAGSEDYEKVENWDWDVINLHLEEYANDEAFSNEIGQYIEKNENTNLIKLTIGRHKYINILQNQGISVDTSVNEMYDTFITLGLVSIALELCLIISTFVFAVQSLIALLKRSSLKRSFLMVVLPLIFVLVLLLLTLLNPIYDVSAVTFATIVLNMLFVIVMAVHKVLFVQRTNSVNVQYLIKNAILFVLGAIACFVSCGALFEVEYLESSRILLQLTASPTKMFNTMAVLSNMDNSMVALCICVEFAYIASMICLITLIASLCRRVCDLHDSQLIARSIVSIVFFVINIIIIFIINGQLNELIAGSIRILTISALPTVNMYMAVAAIIALIVVNQAWNPQPKLTTNNLEKVS